MKKMTYVLLAVCLGWVATLPADDVVPPKTHPDSANWEDLFRKDLSNAIFPKGTWYFQGDVLNATGDQYLWTKKEYRNFIVDVEFKNEPNTNSGVFVYGQKIEGQDWVPGAVEIQIDDDYSPHYSKSPKICQCGSVYGHQAPNKIAVKKAGEWNRMTITCMGPMIYVLLNGEAVTEMDMRKWTSGTKNPDGSSIPPWLNKPLAEVVPYGHVGLQGNHGGVPIHFRNLKIKSL